MAIHHPPSIINKYLQEKIAVIADAFPLYPTMPTDATNVGDGFTLDALNGSGQTQKYYFNGSWGIYDRMFRMQRQSFPHIKCEQLLIYLYSQDPEVLIQIVQKIQDLLDYGDESAQDVNTWYREQQSDPAKKALIDAATDPIFFHNFKVYHLQETRDIVDFGTARTYAANKIIIDYDWHK
jgi:hypothetical protein